MSPRPRFVTGITHHWVTGLLDPTCPQVILPQTADCPTVTSRDPAAMRRTDASCTLSATVELKCNFLGTAAEGDVVAGRAMPAHLGRTTQVWDAVVLDEATSPTLALFRCTQVVLYPR